MLSVDNGEISEKPVLIQECVLPELILLLG